LRIIVCIKQVPALEHMKFDNETRRLMVYAVIQSVRFRRVLV